MVKIMYDDQLIYIWAFFGISLWKEKVALIVFLDLWECWLID